MRATSQTLQNEATPAFSSPPTLLLQRKCACGGSAGMESECKECNGKRLGLQRYSTSRVTPRAFFAPLALGPESSSSEPRKHAPMRAGHTFGQVALYPLYKSNVETKGSAVQPGDHPEETADLLTEDVSDQPTTPAVNSTEAAGASASAERSVDDQDEASSSAEQTNSNAKAAPAPAAGAAPRTAAGPLIVEDDAREIGTGQMRKTEFLDQMEKEVCASADAELAAAGRTAQGCPYIQNWIAFYRTRSSKHVERALQRYAPEAAGAASARDYIPFVGARVQRAAATWVSTGRITGIPPELASQLPGAGLAGAAGGLISGAAGVVAGMFGGIGRTIGGLFTKARDGGTREADDPEAIHAQLGSGQSLDGGVKTRMESALGHDFSRVRVHADATAAELSMGLNARAFTIGSDISFGAGEYQPGTMVGDALLAHELAHVVQQSGTGAAGAQCSPGEDAYNALEEDADQAAVGAVVSLWGGQKNGLARMEKHSHTALRSGLRLQRCSGDKKGAAEKAPVKAPPVERKSVCIRPVQIANDDGSSPTALPSFAETTTIWGKCCVDVTVNAAQKVSKTDFKELDESPNNTPSAEETDLFNAAGAGGSCISVFVAETFQQGGTVSKDISGGGGTYDGGKADPKVVVVEGIHPTIVAHEVGHAMGHSPHLPQGTVMEVTASVHTQKESDKVSQGICDNVRNFVSAGSSGKSDCIEDV